MESKGSFHLELIMKDGRCLIDALDYRLRHLHDIALDKDKKELWGDISEDMDTIDRLLKYTKIEYEKHFGKHPGAEF